MLVRAGLRSVIDGDPAFRVEAEAVDGAQALEILARLRPRLAVLATALQNPTGIEVVRQARAAAAETAIVLLARSDEMDTILDGFRAGAIGFVRADVERIELLTSLHRALAGESVVDPATATQLILRMASESELVNSATPVPLTPRELEILGLMARGHTNREIAERLIVAVGTIKVHVEHILGKLGAADRTQASVRAVELGLVQGDQGTHPTPLR
ncbi:MAG TPA: response regulator transcription factor [Candidatus Binatia bacterium]|nr:response regulator transcription factor [Candidatus Binatia bacterium]